MYLQDLKPEFIRLFSLYITEGNKVENERRKRPVKKPENPVREWISDNLRYIMLFGGIAIAVIIIALVVNSFVSSGTQDGEPQEESSISSEISTEEDSEPAAEPSAEPDINGQTGADLQEEGQQTDVQQEDEDILTGQQDVQTDVMNIVTTYFNALSNADSFSASSVLESIGTEDMEAIENGSFAGGYSNFTVYTYPGAEEDSYVAFVRYEYTYPGYDTHVPGLTQFYILTRDDGSLCIASEETQQSKAGYMESLLTRDDVSELINTVQDEYDAALAADPALAQYIASL